MERRRRNADAIPGSPMRLIKLTHGEIRRMSEDTVDRIKATIDERRTAGAADPGEHGRAKSMAFSPAK